MACMEPASLKTAHLREKVAFSTQNREISRSAMFPDRVSVDDNEGECYTSEAGDASGG